MTVRLIHSLRDKDGQNLRELKEFLGTSGETKPTARLAAGSVFIEVDTGNVYLFNEVTGQWVRQFSLQE